MLLIVHRMRHSLTLFIPLLLWLSPKGAQAQTLNFADISSKSGINSWGTHSGVAFADYDSDGDQDIYVTTLNEEPNLLYRNNGNGTFTEVGEACGVRYVGGTLTSVFGDINNDGHPDLYLGNSRAANTLYLNNGDGTFTDITATAYVGDQGQARSVNMADVNGDGWLDIYVANLADENNLYLNQGDNTFIDVVFAAGVTDPRVSMGAIFFDYDNDGDQDLYLSHDANQPNILYQNNGTGSFTDVSEASGANYAGFGMGVDVADYNNDGWLDIYITNLNENALLKNNGDGTFTERGGEAGVADLGMGWGTAWFDYDNDGFTDLYMVNDSDFSDFANILYRNLGDGSFAEVSKDSPLYSHYGAYGTAVADIDNDGRMDVFVANKSSRHNELFLNETSPANNWLRLQLQGTSSNADAVGARVRLYSAGTLLCMDEISAGSGYAGQNEKTLHFGLGSMDQVDSLVICWPAGRVESYTHLEANHLYTAIESGSIEKAEKTQPGEDPTLVTGIGDLIGSEESVYLFPNPGKATIYLSAKPLLGTVIHCQLFHVNGRLMREQKQQVQTGNIDLSAWIQDLEAGTYLLKIEGQDETITLPLILR